MRLKEYERSNHIELEEMVTKMLELRKKDVKMTKEKLAKSVSAEDTPKDVYVGGRLVTTKMLNATDLTLEQMMKGENSEDININSKTIR